MPIEAALGDSPRGRLVVPLSWQGLINASLALCMASGFLAFIEPSPYDLLVIATLGLWAAGGFTVHPLIVPFAALMALYNIGGFLALLPYLNEPDPTTFMVQSVYLALTAVLMAIVFAENTVQRLESCLKGFAIGCVLASLGAIAGYFDLAGAGASLTLYGRASSTFKDPNVLGSYLVLGALFLMQALILGRARHFGLTLMALLLILSGIFLSFSRGSWGVMVGSGTMLVTLTLLTQGNPKVRRRIVTMAVLAAALAGAGLVALLSIESVREMLTQRFALVQDYDGGETGRFGNQLHAIPMLLERIGGFGPVRFRLFFDEDSHSSYIGAFSSYGWLGGASFFLLVGLTIVIGVRQVLRPSPYQRIAQVIVPCLFALLVQAFQIDIDHWRHVYLMLGAVWGIEAARLKWNARCGADAARALPAT